jgi:hypothetical protein
MKLLIAAASLLLCASLVSGCGGSHRNTLAGPLAYGAVLTSGTSPPHWLGAWQSVLITSATSGTAAAIVGDGRWTTNP